MSAKLQLDVRDFSILLERLGPSLGLWRAAEVAALRRHIYEPPVLDLGCGDGLIMSLVLQRVDIGVDPSREALARAAGLDLYARLEPVSVEQLDLPAGSVGTIVSNSVLEHLPNLPAVLGTAARLLRSGGRLIFTVPTEAFTRWLTLPLSSYSAWRNRHYDHRNLWPIEQWADHLRQAGFSIVSVQPYLRHSFVTMWDAMELMQRVCIGRHRVFSLFWHRLPSMLLSGLAAQLAALDLSAPAPGGGRLIVAQRR